MPYRTWITMTSLPPLIFCYHLPLKKSVSIKKQNKTKSEAICGSEKLIEQRLKQDKWHYLTNDLVGFKMS